MRLIDADALPIKFDGHSVSIWQCDLNDAPTIDAEEVVRCEKCIHATESKNNFNRDGASLYECAYSKQINRGHEYCSWGVKKEIYDKRVLWKV